MTNFLNIQEQAEEHDYRCDAIYPLFGMSQGSLRSSTLGEIITDYDADLNAALGIDEATYDSFGDTADSICGELECWLYDHSKFGYLAKFSKPVITKFYQSSYGSSWGYYQTKWIYADSIEDLFIQANFWADKKVEQWRKEFEALSEAEANS